MSEMEFIKKQAENALDEMMKENKPDWESLEAHLKATGALESYNKDTHHLSFSVDTNAVELIETPQGHPLERFFRSLM